VDVRDIADVKDIASTAKDYEESRSKSTGSAMNIIDVTGVKNIAGTEEDCQKSKDEEILYVQQLQTAPSENEFESISSGMFGTEGWSSERQRPTRSTRRPPHFHDEEFETQFRPEERRQKACNELGRGDQAKDRVDNFCNFHKPRKECNDSGRGDQKKNVRIICSRSNQQSASPSQREVTTQKLSVHRDQHAEKQQSLDQQPVPRTGRPVWHMARFSRKLSGQTFGFRKNQRLIRFRLRENRGKCVNRKRKLNRCPLNQRAFGFRTPRCLVTCNQSDMNPRTMPSWHTPGFRPHSKFRRYCGCQRHRRCQRHESADMKVESV